MQRNKIMLVAAADDKWCVTIQTKKFVLFQNQNFWNSFQLMTSLKDRHPFAVGQIFFSKQIDFFLALK